MAGYEYRVHDLRTNERLGSVPLGGVVYSEGLNGDASLDGRVDMAERSTTGRRLGGGYRDMLRPGRSKITVLRDGQPRDSFIVWDRRYDGRTLSVRCAGMWSYFVRRRLIVDATYTGQDQHDIARALIAWAQGQSGGDIGLELDTTDSGVTRDRTYIGYEEQLLGDLVANLANVDDGFEFAVTTALVDDDPVSTWRPSYPRRGRRWQANGITFTLGQNLRSFTYDELAPTTTMRTIGAGEGTAMLRASSSRADLLSSGWPLLEDSKPYKDVSVQATLQAHAAADLRAANDRAATWTLTLVDPDDTSTPFGAWVVGDDAKIVIPPDTDDYFPEGVETVQRIVGQVVDVPDDGGPESITLRMAEAWHA